MRAGTWLGLFFAASLVGGGRTPGQDMSRPGEPESQDAVAWPSRYANTPEEMMPFRRGAPFHLYFAAPQPFRGHGRDVAPPHDLKAFRIGLLLPAPNGPDSTRGLMMRRGVEMAFEEVNAARRPGEPPFELAIREDTPRWGSSANATVDLTCREGVLAIIGSVEGDATHVALRVALKAEIFILNTATTDPTLTETNIPWILRTMPDDRQHGYRLARLVVQERGLRRIVVLRSNNRYGRVGVRVFTDAVRRLGHPALLEMRYGPGDRTFETQVERICAAEPDAVVLWGDAGDLGRAARALREGGIRASFFGADRLVDPQFLEAAGPAAEGTTATYPFDLTGRGEAWSAFHQRFRERYNGADPEAFAAYAYDGARLLVDAIRKVGPNRVLIRDALAAVRRRDGVAGPMLFDPTLNNVAPICLARVNHGSFKFE